MVFGMLFVAAAAAVVVAVVVDAVFFCHRCCLDIYDNINMNTNDCRHNDKQNESKWNEEKNNSHNETDPDIYVHFRRSLWPHHFILAPTNNFQLW